MCRCDFIFLLFSVYREGFRSELENIVHGQATTQSETSLDINSNDSRNSRVPATSQNVQQDNHELLQSTTEESDTRHLTRTGTMERNIIAERNNQQEADDHGGVWHEQNSGYERRDWQQSAYGRLAEERNHNAEDEDQNWQENPVNDWQRAVTGNGEGEGTLQLNQGVWNEGVPREAAGNWPEGSSGPPRARRAFHVRRYNRFHPPEDDNVYSMELRELLSRYFMMQPLLFPFSPKNLNFFMDFPVNVR